MSYSKLSPSKMQTTKNIIIQEDAFEIVTCKKADMLFLLQYVDVLSIL